MCLTFNISCIDLSKTLLYLNLWLKHRRDLIVRFHSYYWASSFCHSFIDSTTWMRRISCFWILLHFYCIQINSVPIKYGQKSLSFRTRTVSPQTFNPVFVWFDLVCFPLACLHFVDFSVLILLLCVLTASLLLLSIHSACQIKRWIVRARMFIALIYRKRMEQTEYLIRLV